MIIRIVRMSFEPGKVDAFLSIFTDSRNIISSFSGCEKLSLHRDHMHSNVFYTMSQWKSPGHLEEYRNSDLFKTTWAKVKPLFNAQPQVFSME